MHRTATPPNATEDAGKKVPGWKLVLDALVAAPNHTLTNAELGAVPGVQAFHQRLSDLKRRGWVLSPARRVQRGYYGYRLVGYIANTEAQSDASGIGHSRAMPTYDLRAFDDMTLAERAADEAEVSIAKRPTIKPPRRMTDDLAELRQIVGDAAAILTEALGSPTDGDGPRDLRDLARAAAERIASGARAPRAPRSSGPTGPELMRQALEFYGDPCHSSVIAAWVLENGGADVYHGKTPDATMAAQLATSNKTGGQFEKVAPGCYALREWTDEAKGMEPVRKPVAA